MNKGNVLIVAGGTGGHINPGLAVATELRERGYRTLWLGAIGGMEESLVDDKEITKYLLPIAGVRGKGILSKLLAPFKLLFCVLQSMKIIWQEKIGLVVGFGGFASGPGGIAAKLLRKPLFIHEQNAIPGMTNKVLSRFSNRIFQAFEGAFKTIPAMSVGNPLRQAVVEQALKDKTFGTDKFNLLVMGGSRGARVFNIELPKLFGQLNNYSQIQITHQSGTGNQQQVRENYERYGNGISVKVVEYIDDVAAQYRSTDLIICRSGALTVSEVAAIGVPAVFIPFPFAVDDHQTKNAEYLVNQDAGYLVQQQQLNEIIELIANLISDIAQLKVISSNAKKTAKLDATQLICDECEDFIKRKNNEKDV